MQLAKSNKPTNGYPAPNITDLNYEFYNKLNQLTKNITPAQLQILRDYVAKIARENAPPTRSGNRPALSSRETEVLILVTNGYNRRDIGSSLGISKNTAARHIANIYHKLGISCVAEATHYALANNIIGDTPN